MCFLIHLESTNVVKRPVVTLNSNLVSFRGIGREILSGDATHLKRRDARSCNLIAGIHLDALHRVIRSVESTSVSLSHQRET